MGRCLLTGIKLGPGPSSSLCVEQHQADTMRTLVSSHKHFMYIHILVGIRIQSSEKREICKKI